jgi:hypothetical protein
LLDGHSQNKIATLEMKMIVAQFVLGYEYDVVDTKGKVLTRPPLVDYNAQLQVRFQLIFWGIVQRLIVYVLFLLSQ